MIMKKIFLDRFHYYKSLSVDDKREWNTLFIIYPFAAIMLALYFLKYNFLYHVSEYNIYFLSLLFLMFVIIFLGLLSKRKNFAFLTYLAALTLAVFFLIFVSGGVKAPGLPWLTLFGPVYGLFYGKKGILFGMFVSIVSFAVYYFLDKNGLNPNVILQHANYQNEKNSNYFTFLIFMGSNFLAYAIAYERAAKELKEKNEQIEIFLRILFHDVANPLAVISLSSEMMLKRKSFTEEGVLRIKKAATNLKDQLESVKKLKALKDGKYMLDINHFSVKSMIDASVDIFTEKSQAKGIRIVTSSENGETEIWVDYIVFVNQILSNILSNSIKFSYPDSEIIIKVQTTTDFVQILIQDFGIGMSESIRKHLFEVDKVTSRSGTSSEIGSGYGLSLAKHFTESLGGSIDVTSEEESALSASHGTIFTISIPKSQR